jgi:hypothetical protein
VEEVGKVGEREGKERKIKRRKGEIKAENRRKKEEEKGK